MEHERVPRKSEPQTLNLLKLADIAALFAPLAHNSPQRELSQLAPAADQLELLESKVKHPSHTGYIAEMRSKIRSVK